MKSQGLMPGAVFFQENIASLDPEMRRASISAVAESIDAAGELGIRLATIHGGYLPSSDHTPANWETSREVYVDSLGHLVEHAGRRGVTLCRKPSGVVRWGACRERVQSQRHSRLVS